MLPLLLKSFRNLLFPPVCLHCREMIEEDSSYLCHECMGKLQLIDPHERCPQCFSSEYTIELKSCPICQDKDLNLPVSLNHIAAAFDYVGPPASIIRKLKYGNQPYLAKGAGAFLVAQFIQLNWPLPDYIVPVPISSTHWIERGYNQSQLLAENVSLLLNKPLHLLLKRKSGDYSQAGLNRQQRTLLTSSSLLLKKETPLYDKTILLIDDVMTTGSTLKRCAETLREGCPKEIYALTFCRAVQ